MKKIIIISMLSVLSIICGNAKTVRKHTNKVKAQVEAIDTTPYKILFLMDSIDTDIKDFNIECGIKLRVDSLLKSVHVITDGDGSVTLENVKYINREYSSDPLIIKYEIYTYEDVYHSPKYVIVCTDNVASVKARRY